MGEASSSALFHGQWGKKKWMQSNDMWQQNSGVIASESNDNEGMVKEAVKYKICSSGAFHACYLSTYCYGTNKTKWMYIKKVGELIYMSV